MRHNTVIFNQTNIQFLHKKNSKKTEKKESNTNNFLQAIRYCYNFFYSLCNFFIIPHSHKKQKNYKRKRCPSHAIRDTAVMKTVERNHDNVMMARMARMMMMIWIIKNKNMNRVVLVGSVHCHYFYRCYLQ
jgi:hypothetical protein